jgi:hypothetical protein
MNGPEVQPILDSAQRAASAGDYLLAESLLREVARLQTESLGPKHPDLASTFNNLGVVCERTNKLVDAGRYYREALSIASASRHAEDPLVVTSRSNLDQFHRGLGLVENETLTARPAELPRQAIVAGIAVGLALLGALAIWFTHTAAAPPRAEDRRVVDKRLSELGDPLGPTTPSAPSQERAPSRQPAGQTIAAKSTSQPKAIPTIAERPAPTTRPAAPTRAAPVAPAVMTVSAPRHADAEVLEASLCQSLSTSGGRWECTPTSSLAAGDLLYFYTRIASSTGVRIHHRWYRNGILRQDVGLVVDANPSNGYRTFSQRRLESGDWRIAVVSADGGVLREESIEVP